MLHFRKVLLGLCLIARSVAGADVISLKNIDQPLLNDVMEGRRPDLILELPQGLSLPLNLELESDLAKLDGQSDLSIEVTQNLYVKNVGGQVLFSRDFNQWKPLREFVGGKVFIKLDPSSLTLGAEVISK